MSLTCPCSGLTQAGTPVEEKGHDECLHSPCPVPCPTHFAASPCSAMWRGGRGQRVLQDWWVCCHLCDKYPNVGYFFLLGSFCASLRDSLLHQEGTLFSDIWAEFLRFLPWLPYQQSPHEGCFPPSEVGILWSMPLKDLSTPPAS